MASKLPFCRVLKPGRRIGWNTWTTKYWRWGLNVTKSLPTKSWTLKVGPIRFLVVDRPEGQRF